MEKTINQALTGQGYNSQPIFAWPVWQSALEGCFVFTGMYISILALIIIFKVLSGIIFSFDLNTPSLLLSLAICKKYLTQKHCMPIRVDEFIVLFVLASVAVVAVQLIPVLLSYRIDAIPARLLIGVCLILLAHVCIVGIVLFPWSRLWGRKVDEK